MRRSLVFAALVLLAPLAWAAVLVSQPPVSGGGVARSSQLWQDPGPNGDDLDSDAVCWEDFALSQDAAITHIEWWGHGACERGFQIEFWPQDPGTIAYQPLAVFDVAGGGTVEPTARITVTTADYTSASGPGALTHFTLNLARPVRLAANGTTNPRWFIGIIALTSQPFVPWNWSQNASGSSRTFQYQRADGGRFFALGEGRALVLAEGVAEVLYDVTFLAGANGTLAGTTEQTIAAGGNGSAVTAVPDAGYRFARWTLGGAPYSVANPLTVTAVLADMTLTAEFEVAAPVTPGTGTVVARCDAAAVAAGRGLWDLSGSYTTTLQGNPLTLVVTHDRTGRLAGQAAIDVNTGTLAAPVVVRVPMSIRGRVKGRNGALLATMALAGRDASAGVRVALALKLTLSARRLSGPVTGSIGVGAVSTPIPALTTVTQEAPADMDGTWTLQFDLVQGPRGFAGAARLVLSNGVDYLYTMRGKLAAQTLVASLNADPADPLPSPGAIWTRIAALEGGWARLDGFSGSGHGQTIIW